MYYRSKSFKIDENRCTVVQNRWNSIHFISKTTIPLRRSPKKSKKRQAKTLLLQIRCTPIALPAPRPEPLIFRVPPLCLIFDPKPIIPLRTSLKKSKKRQAKTSLLKIRCTPIALAALAALAAYFVILFSARCFFKNMDDLIPSPKIDENRCTVVQNRWKSIKSVVLSCFLFKNR